ncbi:Retrovirus-related Pol polyprotein from transposon TNT 1-94, partial [Trichinella sp. T8]
LNNHGIKVHDQEQFCTGCVLRKHHREGFQSRKYRASAPGKLIHVDLCGPMHVTSLGGSKYFLIFKDDFSRYRRDFFLKRKDDVAQCFETFLDKSRKAGNTVVRILSDGGLEFNNAHVKDVLQRRRVAMRTAMPYTPEHNGVAERENRILVETGRSMLHSKDLPFSLWAKAVNTACNTLNRIGPTTVKGKSPMELWFKRDPVSIDHFHGFGTECFVHVPKQLQRKREKKSVAGRLMGYCDEKDGYRVWLPDINQIVTSRNILFKPEKIRLPSQMTAKAVSSEKNEDEDDSDAEELRLELNSQWTSKEVKCEVETKMEREEEKSEQASRSNKQEEVALSSKQVRKMPNYLSDYVLTAQTLSPSSFHEAMQSVDAADWRKAMEEELHSLEENSVWALVDGKKVLDSRWVLRIKTKADGSVARYKARLVAKGYMQRPGIDYDEIFSPVACFDTVRALLSITAVERLKLQQFDVKTAFLYGALKEEVLYGLKQAPRCSNLRLVEFLRKQGLKQSTADPCLFARMKERSKLLVAIYVHDGIVASSDSDETEQFLAVMKKEFQIKQGPLDTFLDEANAVSTPAEINVSMEENEEHLSSNIPYSEAVGALMFSMTATRPDIAYAAVKRIFRYLRGTADYGLLYQAKREGFLKGYSDADYAGDVTTRRSRTGAVCMCEGGAVLWHSQKQRSVALSTTEAEYVAASEAAKDMMWLMALFAEVTEVKQKLILFVDNMGAVTLSKNPKFHNRSKHIDVRFHFVREKYIEGKIDIQHIDSENQKADILTKDLSKTRFQNLRQQLEIRLYHQNKPQVQQVLTNHGIKVHDQEQFCTGCVLGKHHREGFHSRKYRPSAPGKLIHVDLCGPMHVTSLGGSKYFLVFKDDFSRYRRDFFLKRKDDVAQCFETFLDKSRKAGNTVVRILSDGGLEFNNAHVKDVLQRRRVAMRTDMPYTPEHNGVAERENRILVETGRSMLHSKDLPFSLWAKAVNTACNTLNRIGPTTVKGKSPMELWFKRDPVSIDHFHGFGTECFVHVPKQLQRKREKKSVAGRLMGYCDEKDGYRVWLPDINQIVTSRNILFKPEKIRLPSQMTAKAVSSEKNEDEDDSDAEELRLELNSQWTSKEVKCEVETKMEREEEKSEQASRSNKQEEVALSSKQVRKMPNYLSDYVLTAQTLSPSSFHEAMQSVDAADWRKAMEEELHSLEENSVWALVDGKKVLDSRWVLRIKTKADGSVARYKARLVAKGYMQRPGIDYDEIFSPVACFDTVRALLSITAVERLKLQQFDVKTAFLYGALKEEVLYGLKQAPRCSNLRLVEFLRKQGLKQSTADPCLFARMKERSKLLVAIYVHDGIVASSDSDETEQFLAVMKKEFQIKQGPLDTFLDEANAVSTPAEINVSMEENEEHLSSNIPYSEAVGALMFSMTATRPDIAYAAVKRIFRYLRGTADYGLLYQAKREGFLKGYSDADYAGDVTTRRSRTGAVCMCEGGAVLWHSQKQRSVALSTTEAEYVAASEAAKDMMWLMALFAEVTEVKQKLILFVDNMGAVTLSKNPKFHNRSKHIDVRFHFVREKYIEGKIDIQHIDSENQKADILTKDLSKTRFQNLRQQLEIVSEHMDC